jgi:hypothetical protein
MDELVSRFSVVVSRPMTAIAGVPLINLGLAAGARSTEQQDIAESHADTLVEDFGSDFFILGQHACSSTLEACAEVVFCSPQWPAISGNNVMGQMACAHKVVERSSITPITRFENAFMLASFCNRCDLISCDSRHICSVSKNKGCTRRCTLVH